MPHQLQIFRRAYRIGFVDHQEQVVIQGEILPEIKIYLAIGIFLWKELLDAEIDLQELDMIAQSSRNQRNNAQNRARVVYDQPTENAKHRA